MSTKYNYYLKIKTNREIERSLGLNVSNVENINNYKYYNPV